MGQTLTHGVYLPDEGERNCYSGLAANWQILDTSVGTIAEHTSALSGKAPLVHTHTKSDITDFPALATVATSGSYNDLSNIPASFTPSSHTHGNITNDGKVGTTADKPLITGTGGVVQAGSFGNSANTFCEGNDSRLSDARTPVAHTHGKSDITDLFNSANVWTANNEYKYLIGLSGAEIWFKQPNIEDITANPDANISKSIIQIYNKTVTQYFGGIADALRTDGSHRFVISCFGFPLNNYAGYYPHTFYFEAKRDGTASFSPSYTNASLGTSTNKWKSLNGINPGALSFPSTVAESFNGDITDKTGNASNNKTWSINGWGYIYIDNVAGNFISVVTNSVKETYLTTGTGTGNGNIGVSFPIVSGRTYSIFVKTSGSVTAYYMPTLGNV